MHGELFRIERGGDSWRQVGVGSEAVVGRGGLAWGKGIYSPSDLGAEFGDPVKREGDKCSPAGVFRLNSAFGHQSESTFPMLMPFLTLTEAIEGVDDPHSRYYNRVVDASTISVRDWVSSEKMLAFGEVYRLGVIVEHNWVNPIPGAGSCIFLHPWRSMNQGTSGCTALDVDNVREIVRWLDASKNPILVQMPKSNFSKLGWNLGEFSAGR